MTGPGGTHLQSLSIETLGRPRQADLCECEVIMIYIVSYIIARAYSETLSQKKGRRGVVCELKR